MTKLTVFTPTYNRAYILGNLYNSLCRQTNSDFLWLIVDDGSSDNTGEVVSNWIGENKIEINYIYQENGGKMRAHNRGVKECKTEIFCCVDSDDYLADYAVDEILSKYESIKEKEGIAGIVAYRGDEDFGTLKNGKFPDVEISRLSELYENGFVGDTTLIFKTEILKRNLFPEIEGEKFIPETVVYDKIDMQYKLLVFPKVLTICEYRNDGYTKNSLKLYRDNPKGWAIFYNQKIKLTKGKKKVINASQYMCYAVLGKNKRKIMNSNNKMLAVLVYPLAVFLVIKRKKQYKTIK